MSRAESEVSFIEENVVVDSFDVDDTAVRATDAGIQNAPKTEFGLDPKMGVIFEHLDSQDKQFFFNTNRTAGENQKRLRVFSGSAQAEAKQDEKGKTPEQRYQEIFRKISLPVFLEELRVRGITRFDITAGFDGDPLYNQHRPQADDAKNPESYTTQLVALEAVAIQQPSLEDTLKFIDSSPLHDLEKQLPKLDNKAKSYEKQSIQDSSKQKKFEIIAEKIAKSGKFKPGTKIIIHHWDDSPGVCSAIERNPFLNGTETEEKKKFKVKGLTFQVVAKKVDPINDDQRHETFRELAESTGLRYSADTLLDSKKFPAPNANIKDIRAAFAALKYLLFTRTDSDDVRLEKIMQLFSQMSETYRMVTLVNPIKTLFEDTQQILMREAKGLLTCGVFPALSAQNHKTVRRAFDTLQFIGNAPSESLGPELEAQRAVLLWDMYKKHSEQVYSGEQGQILKAVHDSYQSNAQQLLAEENFPGPDQDPETIQKAFISLRFLLFTRTDLDDDQQKKMRALFRDMQVKYSNQPLENPLKALYEDASQLQQREAEQLASGVFPAPVDAKETDPRKMKALNRAFDCLLSIHDAPRGQLSPEQLKQKEVLTFEMYAQHHNVNYTGKIGELLTGISRTYQRNAESLLNSGNFPRPNNEDPKEMNQAFTSLKYLLIHQASFTEEKLRRLDLLLKDMYRKFSEPRPTGEARGLLFQIFNTLFDHDKTITDKFQQTNDPVARSDLLKFTRGPKFQELSLAKQYAWFDIVETRFKGFPKGSIAREYQYVYGDLKNHRPHRWYDILNVFKWPGGLFQAIPFVGGVIVQELDRVPALGKFMRGLWWLTMSAFSPINSCRLAKARGLQTSPRRGNAYIALSLTGSFVAWSGILVGIGVFGFDSTHMSKLIDGLGKVGSAFTDFANYLGASDSTVAMLSLAFLGSCLMTSYLVGTAFTNITRKYEYDVTKEDMEHSKQAAPAPTRTMAKTKEPGTYNTPEIKRSKNQKTPKKEKEESDESYESAKIVPATPEKPVRKFSLSAERRSTISESAPTTPSKQSISSASTTPSKKSDSDKDRDQVEQQTNTTPRISPSIIQQQ